MCRISYKSLAIAVGLCISSLGHAAVTGSSLIYGCMPAGAVSGACKYQKGSSDPQRNLTIVCELKKDGMKVMDQFELDKPIPAGSYSLTSSTLTTPFSEPNEFCVRNGGWMSFPIVWTFDNACKTTGGTGGPGGNTN